MLPTLIARWVPLLAVAALAAGASAQVMQDPGTLPGGRQVQFPGMQQHPVHHTTTSHALPDPGTPAPTPAPAAAATPAPAVAPPNAAVTLTAPSLLDKPAQPAKITLTSGLLAVNADNSSLTEILHQLAATSGMSIDGLDKDTRVFGAYGPGNPRDILSLLLDGAGYNVMMVGSTDAGAPRELILTERSKATIVNQQASTAPQEEEQDDAPLPNNNPPAGEAPAQPRQVPPVQQQNQNGTIKSPSQILQEMQQMRQQQQQQQPQQPQ
jgi:hypothetical protein